MKILKKDLKKGEIFLMVESKEDLWYLNYLIEPDDIVKGKTIRKIKVGEETARKQAIVKKPVFLKLKAEKTEFEAETLRIRGVIIEGPDDIPKGAHHSFNIEVGTKISIQKPKWFSYQLEKLEESARQDKLKLLIIVHDREEAYFAMLQQYNYNVLSSMKGQVAKKGNEQPAKDFYKEISKQTEEYHKRYNPRAIVVASPAFFKEDLMKVIPQELHKKITLATCSSVGENGIREVLKREETKTALKQERIREELALVDELLVQISQQKNAVYGLEETKAAVEIGAVEKMMVTDKFIHKQKEKDQLKKLDELMKTAEQMKGKVIIISSEHEGGEKLDGLGGIAAITRWKTS